MREKLIIGILMVMVMLFASGCDSGQGAAGGGTDADDQTIIIGVCQPITGDSSAEGKQQLQGIQYANGICSSIEVDGVKYDIRLAVEDNGTSTGTARQAAKNIVGQGAAAVIGCYDQQSSEIAARVFERAGIAMVDSMGTDSLAYLESETYYRLSAADMYQAETMMEAVRSQINTGVVYCLEEIGDDHSAEFCNRFRELCAEKGYTVFYENVPAGCTDFSPYVENAAKTKADVFLAAVSGESAAKITEAAAARGLDIPIVGNYAWDNSGVLTAAKGSSLDITAVSFLNEQDKESAVVADMDVLTSAGGSIVQLGSGPSNMSASAAAGYDAYFIVIEAIQRADSVDADDIRKALAWAKHDGLCGSTMFDQNGYAVRTGLCLKHVDTEAGEWKFEQLKKAE